MEQNQYMDFTRWILDTQHQHPYCCESCMSSTSTLSSTFSVVRADLICQDNKSVFRRTKSIEMCSTCSSLIEVWYSFYVYDCMTLLFCALSCLNVQEITDKPLFSMSTSLKKLIVCSSSTGFFHCHFAIERFA